MKELKDLAILPAIVSLSLLGFTACEKKPDTPGEKLDDVIEDVGDKAEDVADEAEDVVD